MKLTKNSSSIERRIQAYLTPKYYGKVMNEVRVTGASESKVVAEAVRQYYDKKAPGRNQALSKPQRKLFDIN